MFAVAVAAVAVAAVVAVVASSTLCDAWLPFIAALNVALWRCGRVTAIAVNAAAQIGKREKHVCAEALTDSLLCVAIRVGQRRWTPNCLGTTVADDE